METKNLPQPIKLLCATANTSLGPRFLNGDSFSTLDFTAYTSDCNSLWALTNAQHRALPSLSDLDDLLLWLVENKPRHEISGLLSTKFTQLSTADCETIIGLAARLLLMLKFGAVHCEVLPRRTLAWDDGPLDRFLGGQFTPQVTLCCSRVKLPKTFNAWSLEVVGGIKLDFTNNLADHLLLVDDSRVLIFHHASFLEAHRVSGNTLYPSGLVEETLDTLALLFPQAEMKAKHSWMRTIYERNGSLSVDKRIALCGNLPIERRQIERFSFWRDRLVMLKETFDEAKPTGIRQWWHDKRDGPQWFTFWVAVLVLVITTTLGVVQCIEGGFEAFGRDGG